jgi:hypothetical protein
MRLDSFDDRDGLAGVYSLRSRIAARIADKSMPPPATGSLSSEQLEKMQQWIAAGAPRGTAPQSPTTTPPSLTFGSPGAGGLTANTGATLSVQFSGISPNATWSAFYSSNLTASSGGTPIAENLKSSQTTLVWDTSSVPAGEYGIYAVLLDPPQNITVRATGTVIVSHPVASNTAPSVRVTQPNGGQVFLRGSSVNIAWSASDPDSGDLASMKYSVEYSGDAGQSWRILGSPSGSTSWSWIIASTEPLTLQGRIRVRASDGKGGVASDVSDGSFAITMPVIAAPTYADFDAIAQRTCSGGGCHSSGNKDYTSAQSTVTRDKNLIIDRISRDPSVSGYMPKGATLTPSEKETMLNYLKSL